MSKVPVVFEVSGVPMNSFKSKNLKTLYILLVPIDTYIQSQLEDGANDDKGNFF